MDLFLAKIFNCNVFSFNQLQIFAKNNEIIKIAMHFAGLLSCFLGYNCNVKSAVKPDYLFAKQIRFSGVISRSCQESKTVTLAQIDFVYVTMSQYMYTK